MTTVDSRGRIVLPKEIRERLGIAPGTAVEIYEDDGRVVIEREDDPEQILSDIETLSEQAASKRKKLPYNELDPIARDHVDSIREQATDDE